MSDGYEEGKEGRKGHRERREGRKRSALRMLARRNMADIVKWEQGGNIFWRLFSSPVDLISVNVYCTAKESVRG